MNNDIEIASDTDLDKVEAPQPAKTKNRQPKTFWERMSDAICAVGIK